MSEHAFFYIESNVVCTIVLILVLIRVYRDADKQQSQILFSRVLLSQIVYFGVIDSVWMLVDSGMWPRTEFALQFTNILIYLAYSAMGFFWFTYTEYMLKREYIRTLKGQFLASLPGIISCAIVIIAFFAGKGYYLDESGSLLNAVFFYTMITVPFGYLIAASCRAFYLAFSKEGYANRSLYLSVGGYAFPILIAGGLQTVFWRGSFLCFGVMISMIYVYISSLESKIYMDPLTQVNNRNNLNHYLDRALKNSLSSEKLYVLMIDIDRFKEINDMYGHQTGDRALIRLAKILKGLCNDPSRHFVARYGGDEFIIVASVESENEILTLIDSIREQLAIPDADEKNPYQIELSIGYALWNPTYMKKVQDLIYVADEALYEEKNARRQRAF